MKDLDLAIAAQSGKLRYRQFLIRQRKNDLHNDALNYCRKPSTLVGALATGSVLGFIFPLQRSNRIRRPIEAGPSLLQRYISKWLQLLLVNTVARIFTPPSSPVDIGRNDLP